MTLKGMTGLGIGVLIATAIGVCPAQILPVSQDAAARVISLTGQVSVLHDSEPWALNIGDSVQARQVIITGPDGFAQFRVSDGSTFEVYPNSNVVFRKNPPNWRDFLDVLAGRVKVHIEHLLGQPNPNRILTPTAVISVRGTTFDVSVNDNDETTVVTVEEGIVDVRHALKPGATKTLNAGESLHIYRDQPLALSMVDKGALAQRIMHTLADAVYTIVTNPRVPGLPGNKPPCCGQTPPPPPPPGPPPPPPPPGH